MKYYIDQSGKIEQTNIDTVLAIVNGKKYSLVLKKNYKRILEKLFKETCRIKLFPYDVFAALIALLVKKAIIKNKIIIDNEYIGHEKFIYGKILYYLNLLKINGCPSIEFGHVGKLSKAHDMARKVGNKKIKPDDCVKIEEILSLILETKKSVNDRLTQDCLPGGRRSNRSRENLPQNITIVNRREK